MLPNGLLQWAIAHSDPEELARQAASGPREAIVCSNRLLLNIVLSNLFVTVDRTQSGSMPFSASLMQ